MNALIIFVLVLYMSKKTNNREKVKETIENIYYDPGGFGTVYETYKDAKAKNKLVTLDSVKDWFTTNVERKHSLGDLTRM